MALSATMAVADEYWDTELGRIIYEADVEGQAILSFPTDSGISLMAYFPGLAGNYEHRNVHHGIWIMPGLGDCPTEMTGIDGTSGLMKSSKEFASMLKSWRSILVRTHRRRKLVCAYWWSVRCLAC